MSLRNDDPTVITGPRINRKETRREYVTPEDFLKAVKSRFGSLGFDAAATSTSAKADKFWGKKDNAFKQDWKSIELKPGENIWVNCPFGKIPDWSEMIRKWWEQGVGPTLLLTPASPGANWHAYNIFGKADIYNLKGRLKFVGEKHYYPKDCMLSDFSKQAKGRVYTWDWRLDELISAPGNQGKGRWYR